MATAAPQDSIDMGRVMSRGFDALLKNAVPFFAVSLLLAGLPTLLMQWWMLNSLDGIVSDPDTFFPFGDFWAMAGLNMAVAVVSAALAQGILVRSTILHIGGRPIDIGQSIGVVFGLILPVVGLSILMAIIVGVGLMLLVVPGVILALMFCVAVPALVEEQGGVLASLSRSMELTSGSKLLIFVLMILYVLFMMAVSLVFGLVSGVGVLTTGNGVLVAVVEAMSATITTAVGGTMVSSLYIELRTMKEGTTPDLMAEIFS